MRTGNNYSGARWAFSEKPPKAPKFPRWAVYAFYPYANDDQGDWRRKTNLYKNYGSAMNAYHRLQKADRMHQYIVFDTNQKRQVWPPVASEDGEAAGGA